MDVDFETVQKYKTKRKLIKQIRNEVIVYFIFGTKREERKREKIKENDVVSSIDNYLDFMGLGFGRKNICCHVHFQTKKARIWY